MLLGIVFVLLSITSNLLLDSISFQINNYTALKQALVDDWLKILIVITMLGLNMVLYMICIGTYGITKSIFLISFAGFAVISYKMFISPEHTGMSFYSYGFYFMSIFSFFFVAFFRE